MPDHSTDPDRLYWEDIVNDGREARLKSDKAQWALGELADRVATRYGEGDLQQYADAIGVNYETLLDYRTTHRKFPVRTENLPFSVYRVIGRIEDPRRSEMLEQAVRDRWTVSRALRAVQQEGTPEKPRDDKGRKSNKGLREPRDYFASRFDPLAKAFIAIDTGEDVEPEQIALKLAQSTEARRMVEGAVGAAETFIERWKPILEIDPSILQYVED